MLLKARAYLLGILDQASIRLFNQQGQILFQKLVYIWLLGYAIHSLPILSSLYGQDAIMMPRIQQGAGAFSNFIYLLNYVRSFYILVFIVHVLAVVFSLLGLLKVIPKILVVLTGWMMFYGCIPAYNGSYLLMMSFALFLVFMRPSSRKRGTIQLSNLAYLACVLQVCLVYLIAGGYKLAGASWLGGDAVLRVLYLSGFVNEGTRDFLLRFPAVLSVLTHVSLFYQVTFPFLVWFKKLKPVVLTIGLGFHLGLAAVMNLWDFGLAMICTYSLFIFDPIDKIKRLKSFLRRAPQ